MNLTKKLEKTILKTRLVFFQIEALKHPYDKLPVEKPDDVIIDDVLGVIRVPDIVIGEINRAPTGGPVVSFAFGEKTIIDLLFLNWHDVEHPESFLEVLSEKLAHAQQKPEPAIIWAFIPQGAIVSIAPFFVEKDPENVAIYRSYDRDMQPYILTFEKKPTQEENNLGFYCRSFQSIVKN